MLCEHIWMRSYYRDHKWLSRGIEIKETVHCLLWTQRTIVCSWPYTPEPGSAIGFNDKRLVPHQCGTNSQWGNLCGPSLRSSLWGQTALETGASPRTCLAPVVADMNGVSVGASRRVSSLYPWGQTGTEAVTVILGVSCASERVASVSAKSQRAQPNLTVPLYVPTLVICISHNNRLMVLPLLLPLPRWRFMKPGLAVACLRTHAHNNLGKHTKGLPLKPHPHSSGLVGKPQTEREQEKEREREVSIPANIVLAVVWWERKSLGQGSFPVILLCIWLMRGEWNSITQYGSEF